ncbi:hypothetical protein GCM10020331_083380 [Ectobacillus funiculus]
MKIGDVTQTDVAILYIKGIAKDNLVEEVKQRLHTIKTDGILESGNIEAFIEDKTFTVFFLQFIIQNAQMQSQEIC